MSVHRSPLRHLDRSIPTSAFTDTPLAFIAEGLLYVNVPDTPMKLDDGESLARTMLAAIEAEREKNQ